MSDGDKSAFNALSLRDWYAGQAAPALLAEIYAQSVRSGSRFENVYTIASKAAYEFADAMLKARVSPPEQKVEA